MSWREWLIARYQVAENPLKLERRLELLVVALVALLVLLSGLNGFRLWFYGGPGSVAPASDLLAVKPLRLEDPLTPDAAAALLARPLFWEGRRPVEIAVEAQAEVVVTAPPAPARLDGVTLHGVFGSAEALGVIATIDGRVGRINPGQTVKGWRLEGYESGKAIFEQNGRRTTLPLALTTPSVRVATVSTDTESAPETKKRGLSFGGFSRRGDDG